MGAIIYLLELITEDAREADQVGPKSDANKLWKVGAYVCVLTAASLCRHDGFYLDLAETPNKRKSWFYTSGAQQEYGPNRGGLP